MSDIKMFQQSLSWSNDADRAKELVFSGLGPSLLPDEGMSANASYSKVGVGPSPKWKIPCQTSLDHFVGQRLSYLQSLWFSWFWAADSAQNPVVGESDNFSRVDQTFRKTVLAPNCE
jgi:hypothetical protein